MHFYCVAVAIIIISFRHCMRVVFNSARIYLGTKQTTTSETKRTPKETIRSVNNASLRCDCLH